MNNNDRRWSLVNRKTSNVRRSFVTRDAARIAKRSTERIFDRVNKTFVR